MSASIDISDETGDMRAASGPPPCPGKVKRCPLDEAGFAAVPCVR